LIVGVLVLLGIAAALLAVVAITSLNGYPSGDVAIPVFRSLAISAVVVAVLSTIAIALVAKRARGWLTALVALAALLGGIGVVCVAMFAAMPRR
jgi:hypothetical protein